MLGSSSTSDKARVAAPRTLHSHHVRGVTEALQTYAQRGAFRSFSEGNLRLGKVTYRMQWHYNRTYRLILDLEAQSLLIPEMLPGVPPKSPMTRELRAFLKPFGTDQVPEHRRLDPAKGELRLSQYRRALSLRVDVRQQEYVYCARKLVHVAHEVFMVFLREGPYYEYRVEQLGLDPDVAWA
jgi:hypothetical protein